MSDPTAPCGYCRRCAIHDDPGGCLTVEAWERENPAEAARLIEAARLRAEAAQDLIDFITPDTEWPDGWHYADGFDPDEQEAPEEPMSTLYLIEF